MYTKGHYLCWIRSRPFSAVLRALFVTITVVPVALIQCYRTWVGKILRHVGRSPIWQCFFKIKTGNVRISFPNDLRELHCPYLTRGSAKYPFQFQRNSSTINAHKYSFFVRMFPLGTLCLLFPYVLIPSLCSIQEVLTIFLSFTTFSFVASKITNIPSDLRRLSYNHLYKQHTDLFCKQYKLYPPYAQFMNMYWSFTTTSGRDLQVKHRQNGHVGDRRKWPL